MSRVAADPNLLFERKTLKSELLTQDDANPNAVGWVFYTLIGAIDGILNGFPDSTDMGDCNDTSVNIRAFFETGMEYYAEDDVDNGASNVRSGLQEFDTLWDTCYAGYTTQINDPDLLADWWYINFLFNLLFNAGFIFVDIVFILQIWGLQRDEEHTIPYHYAFFIGDFAMRMLYRDEEE
jgi:hypothetical protein